MAASRGEHARVTNGTLIQHYEVLGEIGCGNFSKVYACRDTTAADKSCDIVALKLLKKEYSHDAKFENEILRALGSSNKVLNLQDHFYWNRHPCFVFPLKGGSLRTRALGVMRGHVTPLELRALAADMLTALSYLHFDVKLIHTDLKPENILLDSPQPTGKGLGEGYVVADFGSASFYRPEKLDADLISTRPYRAPEVILGCPWYFPVDMWSLGCILFEVYSGHKLFDANDDATHLSQMEMRLGPLPPTLTKGARNSRLFFDDKGALKRRLNDKVLPRVSEVLDAHPQLCDLIMSMLRYDPERRIQADSAAHHPFVSAVDFAVKKGLSPGRIAASRSLLTPLSSNVVLESANTPPPSTSVPKTVERAPKTDPSRLPAAGRVTREIRSTRLW